MWTGVPFGVPCGEGVPDWPPALSPSSAERFQAVCLQVRRGVSWGSWPGQTALGWDPWTPDLQPSWPRWPEPSVPGTPPCAVTGAGFPLRQHQPGAPSQSSGSDPGWGWGSRSLSSTGGQSQPLAQPPGSGRLPKGRAQAQDPQGRATGCTEHASRSL